ncbi:hypothetical protein [Pseudomonas ekonensis]|uniref:hypothetical protein n=1 Tax=Pseudomonas ekonensis TaxID=2842353 RepID=UPI001CECF948|nr:hypothetical protein [Pseudomonas ekonensis]
MKKASFHRLPQCIVECSINPDTTLAVEVTGPDGHQFAIANINRRCYHGEAGVAKLAREILEEMVLSRQNSHLT